MLELLIAMMIGLSCPGQPVPAPTNPTTQGTLDTGGDGAHIPPKPPVGS